MVGRFTEELKRSLMYYYYCLVMGDSENAARYLSMVAQPGRKGDVVGFRKEVEEICRRWAKTSNFKEYPLAHLILRSVAQGARYDMYFPVETVLMVKALVTFEGVGQILNPGFDVKEVSQKHVNAIFLDQFSPFRLAKEGLRGAPELVEALSKAPMLITEGLRLLESAQHHAAGEPARGPEDHPARRLLHHRRRHPHLLRPPLVLPRPPADPRPPPRPLAAALADAAQAIRRAGREDKAAVKGSSTWRLWVHWLGDGILAARPSAAIDCAAWVASFFPTSSLPPRQVQTPR